MFMNLLSYLGMILGFCLLVFLIATALYYVSEELEAHTVASKRYITRYIYFVMSFHALLWLFDSLPFTRTVFSLAVNYSYLRVMSSFPVVNFASGNFIIACAGAILNHFFWFWHFNDKDLPPYTIYDRVPTYKGETLPPFSQVAAFFGILVWTVPFLLFLSLSANDNTLPLNNDDHRKPQRKGLAKHTVEQAWHWIIDLCRSILPANLFNNDRLARSQTIPI